jgi:phosphohistidine phosphatase
MRHGQAGFARDDKQRILTSTGIEQVKQQLSHLSERTQPVELIAASPYQRAQQTAQLAREQLAIEQPLHTWPELTPDAQVIDCCDRLNQCLEQTILLISHLPFANLLINHLVWGEYGERVNLHTASLACLTASDFYPASAELVWVKHPNQILAH